MFFFLDVEKWKVEQKPKSDDDNTKSATNLRKWRWKYEFCVFNCLAVDWMLDQWRGRFRVLPCSGQYYIFPSSSKPISLHSYSHPPPNAVDGGGQPIVICPHWPTFIGILVFIWEVFHSCMLICYLLLPATWATNSGFDPKVNLTIYVIHRQPPVWVRLHHGLRMVPCFTRGK